MLFKSPTKQINIANKAGIIHNEEQIAKPGLVCQYIIINLGNDFLFSSFAITQFNFNS